MSESWFDMKEAVRMRNTYIKCLASFREQLNQAELYNWTGTNSKEALRDDIKLYESLLENADKRIKAIEKEEADDQS